ncbi:related to CECR1 protein [Cephalotrichum gorgonifer]|uniref:adenosine deaminase n=1 Tax=Cephalotrichum gorgonifer TaxID=2041049 RepID=A0AAE8N3R3_9PEZI|nr:related to CECR1 protein [Cephalotrichum gorgonifer]
MSSKRTCPALDGRAVIRAHDAVISRAWGGDNLSPTIIDAPPSESEPGSSAGPVKDFKDSDDYFRQRHQIEKRERTLGFDYACADAAGKKEKRANELLQWLRRKDEENIYDKAPARVGHGGQKHRRRAGDHFLSNVDLIQQTDVFRVAQRMPKGAHLHIHFNACLAPSVLLDVAKGMDRMFISSNLPLDSHVNFDRCEIQFSLVSEENEKDLNVRSLFEAESFNKSEKPRCSILFKTFLEEFESNYMPAPDETREPSAMEWLVHKLVFSEDEAHGTLQSSYGAWEKFNGRTRMMKGLFNYERAYRTYTRLCLEDFLRDNIQYAEIRPNFMQTNQLFNDDATDTIDNVGIMKIIIEVYNEFKEENEKNNKGYFAGLKVIYCTPRSFVNEKVAFALEECIKFKKEWPEWIAGFDLVGEEADGKPLKQFIPEFLAFRKRCAEEGVEIPFLFHCGETLELGTETDGNLIDALLLGSKRIGHGFALARHPYVMEQMKSRGVCLELCPISNEVLGLTPRVEGHAMYSLLANNVHCTVSSDNGTLFRSTLSHDFYQVMIGKSDMTLHGWRQLIEWSFEHSCMSDEERKAAQKRWKDLWEEFLDWMIKEYDDKVQV